MGTIESIHAQLLCPGSETDNRSSLTKSSQPIKSSGFSTLTGHREIHLYSWTWPRLCSLNRVFGIQSPDTDGLPGVSKFPEMGIPASVPNPWYGYQFMALRL